MYIDVHIVVDVVGKDINRVTGIPYCNVGILWIKLLPFISYLALFKYLVRTKLP